MFDNEQIQEFSTYFQPIGDRVILIPTPHQHQTASGIIIPQTDDESSDNGTVVSVGHGAIYNGQVFEMQTKVGDNVIYPKFGGSKFEYKDMTFYVFRENELITILK